jgi:uncharacterized protein YukE
MVDRQMPDEILERYQNLSHQQLYDMLMAGSPGQVDGLVTSWSAMRDTAQTLADALRTDLGRLAEGWDSAAGREFQHRVGLIATYAETISREFDSIQSGLGTMSAALDKAKSQAESPEATDDMDQTISGAATGAAIGSVLGPVGTLGGGLIGGLMGHNQDEAEKEAAHQRMVTLVAGLAADYSITNHGWPVTPPPPPPDLPTGDPLTTVTPASVPPTTKPRQAPTIGMSTRDGSGADPDATPVVVQIGPSITVDQSALDGAASTGAGAELPGTSLLGAGAELTGASAGGPGTGLVMGAGAAGGVGLGAAGGAAVAGAIGAGAGLGASSLSSASGSHLLGNSGAEGRSGQAAGPRSATLSTSSTSRGAGRSAAGTAGPGQDDEPDERLTWLTEDEMVWGDDEGSPPAVLGEQAPQPTPPPA